MTTAIDTNVIVALWDQDDAVNSAAESALGGAPQPGTPAGASTLTLTGTADSLSHTSTVQLVVR